MPELPEVETTARGIAPFLAGKKIRELIVRDSRLRWPITDEIAKQLAGAKIIDVARRAKYLLIQTDRGVALAHLGMSGRMRILKTSIAPQAHDHYDLTMANGTILRYTDPRRFGCLLWLGDEPDDHPLLANLGPEPLDDALNTDYLYRRSRGKRCNIKSFIMDGHVVVGVGNIYASESLFLAGILPTRVAGSVSKTRYAELVTAIKSVLRKAIAAGGTSFRDFIASDGKPGYFQQELCVYDRADLPCSRCGTVIKSVRLGQRSTFFCPRCQS